METERLYEIFRSCKGVTTDSRTITGGELFFALKGENFDGNEYAGKAVEAGAAYAVVNAGSKFDGAGEKFIPVIDTLAALKQLAAYHRRNVRQDLPVIGLTGTNGKTTTKELIRAVLSVKYNVTATEGNLNNEIGVPLSVLKITPETEIAVIEMGASHPGDIDSLVAVSQPDFGLITNVGVGHIEGFGSFEGVRKTKGELYDYLCAHGGTAFVDVDNSDLMQMLSQREGLRYIGYGRSLCECIVLPSDARHPYLRLAIPENYGSGEELSDCLPVLETGLIGDYNLSNVLAAVQVGIHFGVALFEAIEAISGYVPSNGRSQMVHTGTNDLVVDAYNANLSSMKAALDNFASMEAAGKMVMLGAMKELGVESQSAHTEILEKVAGMKLDAAFFVGNEFAMALENMQNRSFARVFPDVDALSACLLEKRPEGKLILIKGSNSTRMFRLKDIL